MKKPKALTNRELEHIRESYRTAQHATLGHVYRDVMKLLHEVDRLKEELYLLNKGVSDWQEALSALAQVVDEEK